MTGRFQVDLLRPGRAAYSWRDWFLGSQGPRRLVVVAMGCALALGLLLIAGLLPSYWRMSSDLAALPRLRQEVSTSQNDLNLLRANLGGLAAEARRHVRWGDLLTALSNQTPPTFKLQKVEALPASAPAPGQAPTAARAAAGGLRIEALTPLRSGSAPLVDAAQFMAGLMRDPALNRRYELRSWDVRPAAASAGDASPPLLQISVVLGEKAS